jgi:hypothetical protein
LTLDLSVGCGITFCPYVGTRVLKCWKCHLGRPRNRVAKLSCKKPKNELSLNEQFAAASNLKLLRPTSPFLLRQRN